MISIQPSVKLKLAANVFINLRGFWAEIDGLEVKIPWAIPCRLNSQSANRGDKSGGDTIRDVMAGHSQLRTRDSLACSKLLISASLSAYLRGRCLVDICCA